MGDTCGGKAMLITGGDRDRTATALALARVWVDRRRLRPHRAATAEAAQVLGELGADRSAPVADVTAPRTWDFPSRRPRPVRRRQLEV